MTAELLGELTRERSIVEQRTLEARAFELASGVERPALARERIGALARSGELVPLEGGWWTTRQLRALEQGTLQAAADRGDERVGAVSPQVRAQAQAAVHARLGAPLTAEQAAALEVLTGRGGVVVLVGEAGTGKGVVVGAARDAWERDGQRVIGTAVAGVTAKRLGHETGIYKTLTADALLARHDHGRLRLDARTVVVMDEAGMSDTNRLARLTAITRESGAKLVLVGDQAQLSALGAGGLFAQLEQRVPVARLSEVHRARHDWERDAGHRSAPATPNKHSPTTTPATDSTSTRPAARRASGWSATGPAPATNTPTTAC